MPRKVKLSGAQERRRRKERAAAKLREEAKALGLKVETPDVAQPDVDAALLDARRALGEVPSDPRRLAEAVAMHLAHLAREAELDAQLPAHTSREQASRIWALVGKNAAAAKEADELEELMRAQAELRAGLERSRPRADDGAEG